ncbi:MAG: FAD-dependent oxidoreductase [Nibricoccus sp.]
MSDLGKVVFTQTPAQGPRPSVAIFGGGIAGLTVAHELITRGYNVTVYESSSAVGGFFRSSREPETNTPSEYSWHGMGPWYHNTFDLLHRIPFDDGGSIFDRALSRPIDFGIFPNETTAHFYDGSWSSIRKMFRWSPVEFVRWGWLMLKTWTAHRRSEEHYAKINAADAWSKKLSPTGLQTWRSCFGPWIGSDWTKVSLHTGGQFFCKQLTSQPPHVHHSDEHGSLWLHGAGSGWLLFKGPSSDYWFSRWVRFLEDKGASIVLSSPLAKLEYDGKKITGAVLASDKRIEADYFVLATNPFAAAEVISREPRLSAIDELRLFGPLIQDGPHTQVSFRIAFSEHVKLPRPRTAAVLADSPFNLTLFAQEQVWDKNVSLGEGMRSLWTGTSCVGNNPGKLFGLPVTRCSKEQFVEEVREQIYACKALDEMVRQANGGRSLKDFKIVRFEAWHEWKFQANGIKPEQPKWVNTTHTQPFQPRQKTPVPNLFLAGAHTRTEADVWSIEAAVESGRRAAQAINKHVNVLPQHRPWLCRLIGSIDDLFYRAGGPHALDVLLWVTVISIGVGIALAFRG